MIDYARLPRAEIPPPPPSFFSDTQVKSCYHATALQKFTKISM